MLQTAHTRDNKTALGQEIPARGGDTQKMKFLTAVALVMLWVPVDGVAQIDPMAGLTTVDAVVSVTWDDRIDVSSESNFTRQLEDAFRLGLMRAGVSLDEDVPNYLRCSVTLMTTGDVPILAAAYSIELREFVTYKGQSQFATTWSKMGVYIVGGNKLDGAADGRVCAETFELAWRSANN